MLWKTSRTFLPGGLPVLSEGSGEAPWVGDRDDPRHKGIYYLLLLMSGFLWEEQKNPVLKVDKHVGQRCFSRLFQAGSSLHGSLAVGTTCCFINHCWTGSSSRWMNRKTPTSGRTAMFEPHFILWICMSSIRVIAACRCTENLTQWICEMKLWMVQLAKYIFVVSRCRGYAKEKSPTMNYAWHIEHIRETSKKNLQDVFT